MALSCNLPDKYLINKRQENTNSLTNEGKHTNILSLGPASVEAPVKTHVNDHSCGKPVLGYLSCCIYVVPGYYTLGLYLLPFMYSLS